MANWLRGRDIRVGKGFQSVESYRGFSIDKYGDEFTVMAAIIEWQKNGKFL